jgi:hypothetical protein
MVGMSKHETHIVLQFSPVLVLSIIPEFVPTETLREAQKWLSGRKSAVD